LPFNFLGDFTDDRLCLSIDHDGKGNLVRTPKYSFEENTISDSIKVTVTEENTHFDVKRSFIGIPKSNYAGLADISEKDQSKFLRKGINKSLGSAEIIDFELVEDAENPLKLDLNYNFSTEKLKEHAGIYVILPIDLIKFDLPDFGKSVNRKYPIYFPRDKRFQSYYEIDLPSHLTLSEFKGESEFDTKYGKYRLSANMQKGKLVVNRLLEINKGNYSPEEFDEIKEFFKNINKNEQNKCVLEISKS